MSEPRHIEGLRAVATFDQPRGDSVQLAWLRSLLADYDRLRQLVSDAAGVVRPFALNTPRWKDAGPFLWRGIEYPATAAVVHVDSITKYPVVDHDGVTEDPKWMGKPKRLTIGDFRDVAAFLTRLEKEIGK